MTAFSQAGDLSDYQWKNRIILVFGSSSLPEVENQLHEFRSDPMGIMERDLLIMHITENKVRSIMDVNSIPLLADHVRAQFGIQPGTYRCLLIGKDGGVKLDKSTLISNKYLFSVIDSMPMRRREMQRKKEDY
jgi:hypothetical protein